MARSIEETASGLAIRTYGEGIGWLQSSFSPVSAQKTIDFVWNSAVRTMQKNHLPASD